MDNQIKNQDPLNETPIIPTEPVLTPPEPVTLEPIIEEPIIPQETPILIEPQSEPSVPSNEYQQIIDEYAAKTNIPEPTETPVIENPSRSSEEQLQSLGVTVAPPKTGGGFFKILFIIALVIFVLVLAALGFIYFKSQKITNNSSNSSFDTVKTSPTPVSGSCLLNEKTYQVGESFVATDGCNTCSCESQNVITCTEKECLSATPATKSATTSSIPKDWKTYTNSTYKYSVQYPSDWKTNSEYDPTSNRILSISSPEKIKSLNDQNNKEGYLGDDFNIEFFKDYKNSLLLNRSIETYFSNKDQFSSYQKIKIGQLDGYKAVELGMVEYPLFYVIKGNDIFIFSSNIDFSKIELQILDTFKFN